MDVTDYMLIEHLARYHFANLYVKGRVLDLACGSGYGTHIIAKRCRNQLNEVIGIDNSREALDYARYSYYHPKSTFIEEDVVSVKLPIQLGQFDFIVSLDRKSTRLNSSHVAISYAVFCLKKKTITLNTI